MTTTPQTVDAALALDVLAALLASGQSVISGLNYISQHLPGCTGLQHVSAALALGVDWDEAWALAEDNRDIRELNTELKFTYLSSVPTAAVLNASASTLRRNRKRRAEQLAAELGIRLVIPLGICLLPSFLCLGVIPMVIALLPSGV